MKLRALFLRLAAMLAAGQISLFQPCHSLAQGSLTPPPGPPSPTMKSLDQVEPRTIINAANTPGDAGDVFIISKSGSYYLTGNVMGAAGANGITITASNVTVDLRGFSLMGCGQGNAAISIPNQVENVSVRGGSMSGWEIGVSAGSFSSASLMFEDLNVSSNSVAGININGAATVLNCNCQTNGADGLGDGIDCVAGTVSGCTAIGNGATGISIEYYGYGAFGASVINCVSEENGQDGIDSYYATVTGCTVANNGLVGIDADGGVVTACSAYNDGNDDIGGGGASISSCQAGGIYAANSVVTGCQALTIDVNNGTLVSGCSLSTYKYGITVEGSGNSIIDNNVNLRGFVGLEGIYLNGSTNYVDGNQIMGNFSAGIEVVSGNVNNVIVKNSVTGSGANDYVIPSGNDVGPIGTAATSTSPWANIAH